MSVPSFGARLGPRYGPLTGGVAAMMGVGIDARCPHAHETVAPGNALGSSRPQLAQVQPDMCLVYSGRRLRWRRRNGANPPIDPAIAIVNTKRNMSQKPLARPVDRRKSTVWITRPTMARLP